ncbi:glycosyltransferase family 2 protein [Patescibacteria group bacterium]
MKVSVIIPIFNEEDVILNCLESLEKQTLKDFEVIVVDDGSTDNSLEILGNYKASNYMFSYLLQNHLGTGFARNFAVKEGKGEILVFVDADMTFDKDFLKKLIKPIEGKKAKGTFSKKEYVSNWENVWARCWNINENWEEKRRHPKNYPNKQKVFRAILKKEFDRVGGFTPGGYNDDWSLFKKLKYKAQTAEGAIFYHKNPSSLKEIFQHAKWVGKRPYKLGIIGKLYTLWFSLFPFSTIFGFYKYLLKGEPAFVIFKIVYDFGIFYGILEAMITKNYAK